MPIEIIFFGSTLDSLQTLLIARQVYSHHKSGSCSAQSFFIELILISFFGSCTLRTLFPDSDSTKAALTEELPTSKPKKYI